ncbi:hypothetical protein [Gilvimarinus polysaccharolyticus]|uniref:hypothetical protein n=1 Tax=Gilvimarinus polysaccharolyticus TaxID=863921 RepID=UPI0006738CF9|nr:hypothetical protein [Gilvimarinus polysaccharolyticus]
MAVISLKGLLMDKGGHSVDRWRDQVVQQLHVADQTARNVVKDWSRFNGPGNDYITLCYTQRGGSHVKRFDLPEARVGDLRWRVMIKGQKFGFALHSFVRLTSGVRERVDNSAKVASMISHMKTESPELVERMYAYDAVAMRLRAEIDSYQAIFKSLVMAQVWKDDVSCQSFSFVDSKTILQRSAVKNFEV